MDSAKQFAMPYILSIASETTDTGVLLRKALDIDGRSGPLDGAVRYSNPFSVGQEIFKGENDHALCEQIWIPFGKPDFSRLPVGSIFADPDD